MTEKAVKAAEAFIRETLMENFSQDVAPRDLRLAAEKLCRAISTQSRRKKE